MHCKPQASSEESNKTYSLRKAYGMYQHPYISFNYTIITIA